MNKRLDGFLNLDDDALGFFDQVFLFGSFLRHNRFNDIDILLVYEAASPIQVNFEKGSAARALAEAFPDFTLHLTTVSMSELQQTAFLEKVPNRKIKG